MNRNELITAIAKKANMSKAKTEPFMDAVFEVITDALIDGESVKIMNFGIFEIRERAERVGRNPRENVAVKIPATKVPIFRFSESIKEAISK